MSLYPCSVVVVVVVVYNIQSSPRDEIAGSIKAKLHVEHPLHEGGIKVCINGLGHIAQMAARAINSKILKKFFFGTGETISK